MKTLRSDISGYYRFLRKPTESGIEAAEYRITFSPSRQTPERSGATGPPLAGRHDN
jgi:hypothetical protein